MSEKKKTLSADSEEKRTLNDMQKARGASQPTLVIAMSMQGQQQQNVSGSMMQLNMNQLQITNRATGNATTNVSKHADAADAHAGADGHDDASSDDEHPDGVPATVCTRRCGHGTATRSGKLHQFRSVPPASVK